MMWVVREAGVEPAAKGCWEFQLFEQAEDFARSLAKSGSRVIVSRRKEEDVGYFEPGVEFMIPAVTPEGEGDDNGDDDLEPAQ